MRLPCGIGQKPSSPYDIAKIGEIIENLSVNRSFFLFSRWSNKEMWYVSREFNHIILER